LAVLVIGEGAPSHVVFLGLLNGLSIGFYFLGQHELTFEVTTPRNRDRFFSLNQIFAASLRLFSLYLASRIIALFRAPAHPDRGYQILFAISLALYLALFFESFAFGGRAVRRSYAWWAALREHMKPRMRPVMGAYLLWGLRNGLFWFILGVLIYRASNSELTVGNYDWLTQLILLVMGYWLVRAAHPGNRGRFLGWSAFLDVAGVGILVWRLDVTTLLCFVVLYAVATAVFKVTFTSYSFDIMEAAGGPGRTLENLAVREVPLNAGRVLGLLLFLWAVHVFGEGGLKAALFFLGSAHVGVWWILSRWGTGNK
jgi:YQGE family putative transporter